MTANTSPAASTVTREAWLLAAVEALRPKFIEIGMPLPEAIRISVGFGYGSKRESANILGQCWSRAATEDAVNTIFISPELDDAADVLSVLVHELIHAADDNAHGHKGAFAEAATRLGLEGKMTATVPGLALYAEMVLLAESLGSYSHKALQIHGTKIKTPVGPEGEPIPGGKIHSGPAKQGTRMVKVACSETDCACGGYTVRTTAKWLAIGFPLCPMGTPMETA